MSAALRPAGRHSTRRGGCRGAGSLADGRRFSGCVAMAMVTVAVSRGSLLRIGRVPLAQRCGLVGAFVSDHRTAILLRTAELRTSDSFASESLSHPLRRIVRSRAVGLVGTLDVPTLLFAGPGAPVRLQRRRRKRLETVGCP